MPKCVICNRAFDGGDPAVLTMGAYGNPRYLCEECAQDLDTVTLGKDPEEISLAMGKIVDYISANDVDKQTFDTVNEILLSAKERLEKIKDGSYDFSLDEADADDGEGFDEIPPELTELESDKELDRIDEEKYAKIDKVLNVVTIIVAVLVGAFVVWRIADWLL